MKDNTIKITIGIISIILLFTLIYILLKNLIHDDVNSYEQYLKNYDVNEYITTYVSDEDMARIYLNDYIHNMFYDTENAYNLLDEEYKSKKFNSLSDFTNYVNSLNYSSFNLLKYYIKEVSGYKIFGVYDNNNNFFAFKTNGVMQYTVYLDDYTVEIW